MTWLIVLGMFLLTAFVTWGLFANIEDARQMREAEEREAVLAAAGDGALATKLTDELRTIAERGDADEAIGEVVALETARASKTA